MNPNPPPMPGDPSYRDADHLNLLSVFHFVGAGLALLGVFFLVVHFIVFQTLFSNPTFWANSKQGPPPAELMGAFKWLYLLIALWFVASGVLNLLSGWFLRTRKHRTFSLVVAAINCLHMPLGTLLGVFTFLVLLRDTVRQSYEAP